MASVFASLGARYAAFAAAALVAFIVAVIVKRRHFHPYSKVPGPFLAKVTSLYSAYHSWRGTMHLDVQRCHQRYGDLIRYAPNQVLSLHPPDMAAIYGHGAPFRKAKGYKTMIPIPDGWSTMTSIDKTLHHNLRRVFRSGVGADYLARFEPAILRNLKVYFGQLQREMDADGWSAAADMRKWNLCLGFDTMADFGLGIKTDLLRSPAREFVFPALYVHEKKMGLWEQLPIFSTLGIGHIVAVAFLLVSSEARKFAQWYKTLLDQAIADNASTSRGIFGPVIQSGLGILKNPGHNYAQMIGEGAFSTFSSADAYGIMVSGFVHYLTQYPYVYEKLAAEMRSMYTPGEDIPWDARLESNVYLRAVINEVMRLLPPACGVHWRECERPGVTVGPDGVPLTVGSDVGMSIFSLFRDGRIFRDPVRFWPERWIPGTIPETEYSLAKTMFRPFLIGPRNCAGSHVAIMIGSIAYAYILVNYDFRRGQMQRSTRSHIRSNARGERGADKELVFESHYSIAGWESGPFIQFKAR
ncbi:cytochrome p450 [Hirsutella rhossiliensis]|uniref:Cytochrome p450 domain-containing protein n=1 Tax=Hirsutella rhossiliensis TaxID=111463 RepID=A0A9P8SIH0_9HYPO|nr:cytochrome p450 domain-containing protein [Hirsutella rhossiliensis]KAH0964203.1 cytochrome p450 domain-containing protein [Hirsutella rhossiliensis]